MATDAPLPILLVDSGRLTVDLFSGGCLEQCVILRKYTQAFGIRQFGTDLLADRDRERIAGNVTKLHSRAL